MNVGKVIKQDTIDVGADFSKLEDFKWWESKAMHEKNQGSILFTINPEKRGWHVSDLVPRQSFFDRM